MTALKKPELLTVNDYLGGEELAATKHEYIAGAVHAMAGATNRHNIIAGNAYAASHFKLRGKKCRPFNSDTKVRLEYQGRTRFYYPDAMVVCDLNPEDDHFQQSPVVILEVLSKSTWRTDFGEKKEAYLALPSLRVLLFVESEKMGVTVWRRDDYGGFQGERYDSADEVVDLPEIGVELPLAELYEGVEPFAEVEDEDSSGR